MITRRFGSLGLLSALLGCASPRPSGGPPSAPPAAGAAGASGAGGSTHAPAPATNETRASIELTPLAAPPPLLPAPRLEVQRPTLGEVIETPLARRYEVRLEVSGFVLTRAGQGAIVSLDGRRPRRWPDEGALTLGQLLPENEELAEGPHALLVVLVDAEGRVLRRRTADGRSPFFLVDFSVGRAAPLPNTPRVFCLSPTGTYYGTDGVSARLELFPVGPIESTLRLRVEGPGVDASTEVRPDQPYLLSGLPFGDVSVTALRGGDAVARCLLTVNPEKSR